MADTPGQCNCVELQIGAAAYTFCVDIQLKMVVDSTIGANQRAAIRILTETPQDEEELALPEAMSIDEDDPALAMLFVSPHCSTILSQTCPVFWPNAGSMHHRHLRIDHVSTDVVTGGVLQRKFKLRNTAKSPKSRLLKQFHLQGWRKGDVNPPSVDLLVRFLGKVERWQRKGVISRKGPSSFRLADGKTCNASKFKKVRRASATLYTWGRNGTARGRGSLPTCGGPTPEITTRSSAAAPSAAQAPTSPAYAAQAPTSPSAAQEHGSPAVTQSAKSPGAATQQRRVQPPRKILPPERYGYKV
ncbi:hypothetical protein HPB51_016360 [Rhipicephalus microplus]|uniref:Tyrosine-protein phosphatase domain-containing protein n=1 Tax=Rhipicephalus microplus TaxID=6941 RepID=A0A9J6EPV5_RHIMP|nr:hypothetical protein HPB51_016360 [Rhipicephalus microplus]